MPKILVTGYVPYEFTVVTGTHEKAEEIAKGIAKGIVRADTFQVVRTMTMPDDYEDDGMVVTDGSYEG